MRTRDWTDAAPALNGGREGSPPQTPLSIDLLEAETVLTALAGVFYPTETPPGQKSRALIEELAGGEKD